MAPAADCRLRRHGDVRGNQSRREEPRHLARELLQGSRRLGHSEGRALRLRSSGRPAGSVRNLRVARHPAHRGSRDLPGQGAVHRRRPSVRPRIVGHQAGAALRRVCQDDAGAAAVPGPSVVSGWPTQAAVRRDRAHARSADGRRGRSDRAAVRGQPWRSFGRFVLR